VCRHVTPSRPHRVRQLLSLLSHSATSPAPLGECAGRSPCKHVLLPQARGTPRPQCSPPPPDSSRSASSCAACLRVLSHAPACCPRTSCVRSRTHARSSPRLAGGRSADPAAHRAHERGRLRIRRQRRRIGPEWPSACYRLARQDCACMGGGCRARQSGCCNSAARALAAGAVGRLLAVWSAADLWCTRRDPSAVGYEGGVVAAASVCGAHCDFSHGRACLETIVELLLIRNLLELKLDGT
jgi:hypothetical protein